MTKENREQTKKKTIIRIGNRKPYISLEKALSREYEVLATAIKKGKQKGRIHPLIRVPQILIGHKVKLILVK